MAVRNIRKFKDEALRKKCKKVDSVDGRILTLLEDLVDTMYKAEGVGLAAPQVGVLKRVVVIDIGEGLIELINPIIVYQSGEQTDEEGCLSFPGKYGYVTRPNKVIVRAQNRKGETFEMTGKGLLARAFCHEIDHLDGELFIDKIVRESEEE